MGSHQKLMAAQRSIRGESLPNYYAVLGVDKSASPAAIRTAFRCRCNVVTNRMTSWIYRIMLSSGVVTTHGLPSGRPSTVPARALLALCLDRMCRALTCLRY